jgi:hypothetical protein
MSSSKNAWRELGTRGILFVALPGVLLLSLCVGGCAWGPIKHVTSLSPAIKADTIDYNDAVGDAADRILLTNILRSRDAAPLNLSQLSSLSGTLTLQGTLGFSLPWGKGQMGMGPNDAQNVATPSIMGSTTPTYSLTPLNTQAFMLSILQPVSAAYVLSRWQAGLSREMLLRLFIKEIDFPDASVPGRTFKYINDPDIDARIEAFDNLVAALIAANAQLKAFDVLDPVGEPFSLYAATTTSTPTGSPAVAKSQTTPTTNADATAYGQITGANDGQYHVGNIKEAEIHYSDNSKDSLRNAGQLYRVYAGQVELCVAAAKIEGHDIPGIKPVAPGSPPLSKEQEDQDAQQVVGQSGVMLLGANPQATGPTAGGPTAGAGGPHAGAAAPGATSSASSGQAVTAALQAGRVSALVNARGCQADEIVLHHSEEHQFARVSKEFVHIQWRSVSEIFDYLGAVLRYEERHRTALVLQMVEDDSIQLKTPSQDTTSGQDAQSAKFFHVYKNPKGRLTVSYDGSSFGTDDMNPANPYGDYTMAILSMLSTLVNLSAQPSLTSSQPLRLLPIP